MDKSKRLTYEEQAVRLSKAIDVAVNVFEILPPKEWDEKTIQHVIKTYLEFKRDVLNPEPQFKNVTSLKYQVEAVFTYFQEGSGKAVDLFWQELNKQELGYKRENKLSKILKRKKIKNQIEYDFIIDVMVPYKQENVINEEEWVLLNNLIAEYENSRGSKRGSQ